MYRVKRNGGSTIPFSASENLVRYMTLQSHKPWSVCQVIVNPGRGPDLPLCLLSFLTKQIRLDCVKLTGEIKEHALHSAIQITLGF